MKPIQRKQSGQSLVELAISLMIILLLLLGAVEISIALFQYVTIRDAAQEGALYGSTNPADENGIQLRAAAAADDMVSLEPLDNHVFVELSGPACEGLTDGVANSVTIRIIYEHHVTFPLAGSMFGDTITLRANVTNAILSPQC